MFPFKDSHKTQIKIHPKSRVRSRIIIKKSRKSTQNLVFTREFSLKVAKTHSNSCFHSRIIVKSRSDTLKIVFPQEESHQKSRKYNQNGHLGNTSPGYIPGRRYAANAPSGSTKQQKAPGALAHEILIDCHRCSLILISIFC